MAKEWIVPDTDLGCDGAYFDYQELVRCEECVFFDGTKPGQPNILCFQMHENDYCSYGERKDGADNGC